MPAGRWIELTAMDDHRLAGWLAEPVAAARGAVVVVQEIFGVNGHIRAVTEAYADAGFRALAPALLDRAERGVELGYDEAAVARGRELVVKVGFDNALRDIAAAAAQLAAPGRTAVVGYCWGGTAALLANTRMKLPAVSYYGGRSMPFLHERPGAPLMLHFGERDPIIPSEHRARIIAAFPEAHAHVYPAGHGFNCSERADYDAPSAALARERTLAFLTRHLGSR
jgi:carboxymethylenebutenolidase